MKQALTTLILVSCSGCTSSLFGPRVEVQSDAPKNLGSQLLHSISTGEGIIVTMGSVLCIAAVISIIAPVLSKSMPNWTGTLILLGSAIGFWVLAAVYSVLMAYLIPVFVIGLIAAVFVFRHHIVKWAEKKFGVDFNHDGSVGR